MSASIEAFTLKNVLVQSNGIIRNEKGYLIGRTVVDIDPQGEHVRGVAEDLEFRRELARVINCFSRENGSNTQDFILARFLDDCLAAFDRAQKWKQDLATSLPTD